MLIKYSWKPRIVLRIYLSVKPHVRVLKLIINDSVNKVVCGKENLIKTGSFPQAYTLLSMRLRLELTRY